MLGKESTIHLLGTMINVHIFIASHPISGETLHHSKGLHESTMTYQKAFPRGVLPQCHSDVKKYDSIADHEDRDVLSCRPVDLILQRPLQTDGETREKKRLRKQTV